MEILHWSMRMVEILGLEIAIDGYEVLMAVPELGDKKEKIVMFYWRDTVTKLPLAVITF